MPTEGAETPPATAATSAALALNRSLSSLITLAARPQDLERYRQDAERLDQLAAARLEALEVALAARDAAWAAVTGAPPGGAATDVP